MESPEHYKDIILADLPSNGDEPAGLRESIAEELSDHLHCAMRRELLNDSDQMTAKERVMNRFGNVNSVATRLWFDAMKQRLVTQRFLLAAAGLMTVACLAIGAIAWLTVTQLRDAIDAETVARKVAASKLIDSERKNHRLLEQLALFRAQEPTDNSGLQNPDMELVDDDSIRDWADAKADRAEPYEGEVSARMDLDVAKDNAGKKLAKQRVDATPYRGKRVRFSCAVRMTGDDNSHLDLVITDGKHPGPDSGPIRCQDWTRQSVTLDIPESSEEILLCIGLTGDGSMWFDAARLEVLDDDSPLQHQKPRNPDMETIVQGRPDGWMATADTDDPFAGKVSARVEIDRSKEDDGMKVANQVIDATPYRGKRVRWSAAARVKSSGADGGPLAGGQLFLRADNSKIPGSGSITTDVWGRHSVEMDIPQATKRLALCVALVGEGVLWFDDVKLEVVGDASTQSERRPGLLRELKNGRMELSQGGRIQGWNAVPDASSPFEGETAAKLVSNDTKPAAGMTSVTSQVIDATAYRGQRIRFRSAVRVESEANGRAQLWCRVDRTKGKDGRPRFGAFDNMQDRPITDSEWKPYEIVLDVAEDAEVILAGIFIIGHKTKVWFDDVSLEIVEDDEIETTSVASPAAAPPQPFFNHWLWLVVITLGLMVLSQRTKRDNNGLATDSGFATKFALRFTVAYWLLYSFPQPFTGVLPGLQDFSVWYTESVDKLVRWVAADLLGIKQNLIAPNGSGDTTFAYVRLLTGFALAVGAALLWSAVDWRKTNYSWTKDLLRSYVRYVLAFTMLGYGLAKAGNAMNQFPEPGDFHLSRTYGESSPMGLLWTFMGASRSYTIFSGLAECLCALLLVWRRTTTLGSIVTFCVMLNVVMLNFCYDVPVKQYSVHLLAMAVFIALPDLKRVLGVLLFNRATQPIEERPPYAPGKLVWIARIVKVTVIVVGLGIPIYGKIKSEVEHARIVAADPEFMGKFDVKSANDDAILKSITFFSRPYSPEGKPGRTFYLRLDGGGAGAREVPCSWDGETIRATGELGQFSTKEFTVKRLDEGEFEMSVVKPKPAVYTLRASKDKPLLTSRGFRWINEVPFNR